MPKKYDIMNRKLKALLKLLADEDQTIANFAMAEILSSIKDPENILSRIQESSLKNLRKRSHQMQGVLHARRERSNLFNKIEKNTGNLIENLIDIHLLWFNEDKKDELLAEWKETSVKLRDCKRNTFKKIILFMKTCRFKPCPANELFAEYFCIGSVINKKTGSDCILASITSELARENGIKAKVLKTEAGFGVSHDMKKICLPSANWALISNSCDLKSTVFTPVMICRYAASMLFLCAIISGSFRYVNTIGTSLLGGKTRKTIFDVFPYPFGVKNIF